VTEPRRPRRLVRRLFTGQMLVILIGAVTLGAVAFLIAPPIFDDHVRRAVGPVSEVVAHHLDAALSETLAIALTLGIVAAALAAAAVSWLLARRIARPVEQLSATADALAAGHLDARAARPTTDDELTDLTDAFNGMATRLEDTEKTRRGLLADLAHELRTPLATIEAYHEGLVDRVIEPDADTWATLQEATGRLQRLVEDLGLVSRAEEGRLPLDLDRIDIGEVAERAVESFAPAAQARDIALEVQASPVLPPVTGDRDRLGQVLTNLLANALEHTPDGGRITITVTPTNREVVVMVSDTGVGIAPEHLPHLFQRFYRADPARRHTAGSGIGLTISRAIVHGHGGELTAHSDGPGRGATLTFRLPVAGTGNGSGPEASSASGSPGPARKSRRGNVGTS